MSYRPRIGVLYSRVRVEEKWIFSAFEQRGVDYDRLDNRSVKFDLLNPGPWLKYDAILERSINFSRGLYALQILNSWGIPTVNSARVAEVCGDKITTTTALANANIPQPETKVAFTTEAALDIMDQMGYPVVVKPNVGSWGRLLAKVNDREAAEAILEHKATLGSYQHSIFYIQEYIKKPGRDIRVAVMDDKVIYAMYRKSDHWLTNTAKGAIGELCQITPELEELAIKATQAVGGGLLAVDIFEHPEKGLMVNEINHTMEFHTAQPTTGLDIAGLLVDYIKKVADQNGHKRG